MPREVVPRSAKPNDRIANSIRDPLSPLDGGIGRASGILPTFYAARYALGGTGHAGILHSVRLFLSGAEIIAALLFLVPLTTFVGGYMLLAIFGLAIVIHGLHGEFGGLEILVLYGVAVWVSRAARKDAEITAEGQLPTSKSFEQQRTQR